MLHHRLWYIFLGSLIVVLLIWILRHYRIIERYYYDFTYLFSRYDTVVPQATRFPWIRRILPNPEPSEQTRVVHLFNAYQPHTLPADPKAITILFDGEGHTNAVHDFSAYTLVFTTKQIVATQYAHALYVPAWSSILGESANWTPVDLLDSKPNAPVPKSKFCAYMYSNCDHQYNGVRVREELFRALHARKRVDALGTCNHNVDLPLSRDTPDWLDRAVQIYRPYKFVMACENILGVPGYVSEKVVLALLAGAVPIYSGDSTVQEQFHPNCMIRVSDFPTLDACVDYILQVDADPMLYRSYVTAPKITATQLATYAGWYLGTRSFYDRVFQILPPSFRRTPYVPLPDRQETGRLDPTRPVKVIHLERSADRWSLMLPQLQAKSFLRYEIFPAVDGQTVVKQVRPYVDNSWLQKAKNIRSTAEFLPGEIGVYLSTMEIYTQLVRDRENDWYMLMEDDLVLGDDLQPLEDYIHDAPQNWDMIYLGICQEYCYHEPKKENESYIRLTTGCMPCNFAVIVRKRAAQFFLNFAFPMLRPIDEFHRNYFGNIHAYLYDPAPISTRNGQTSTIR